MKKIDNLKAHYASSSNPQTGVTRFPEPTFLFMLQPVLYIVYGCSLLNLNILIIAIMSDWEHLACCEIALPICSPIRLCSRERASPAKYALEILD